MSKENDVPKDLPILKPSGRNGGRPSLEELAGLGANELAVQLQRALPGKGDVPVAAFNSSI